MTSTCTLRVISGPAAGIEVEVERELTIGRERADLTIADDEMSRPHAAVRPLQTGVVVEDLGSLNGTFVNGDRIDRPVTLTADTTVRVGQSELSLQIAIAVVAPEPEGQKDDAGLTRMSGMAPPEPIAQPEVTRVRPVVGEQVQEPMPIAPPEVTRVRPILSEEQVAQSEPIAQPQVTRVSSAIPEEQAKPQGNFKRLLERILGRGRGDKSS